MVTIELEKQIAELMEKEAVAGLSLALVQEAQLVWKKGFGCLNKATGQPVTTETIFEAASLSKPLVAYAALKLCQSGDLDLDRSLTAYLPEPYLPDEPQLALITARIVLSHTSGFPNWRKEGEALRSAFRPGQHFSYSGEGYVYLQKVLEHLTGNLLAGYMRLNVLDPLRMHNSSFVWLDQYAGLAATGHEESGEAAEKWRPAEANAAYSLHTTPAEFALFLIEMMQPSQRDFVSQMLQPHIQVYDVAPDWPQWPQPPVPLERLVWWSLGWGLLQVHGETWFWQWGDNGRFQAYVIGSMNRQAGVVMMANSRSARNLWQNLLPLLLG